MTVILDPELKALMAQDTAGAVLWQDASLEQTALLAKASDADVASFQGQIPINTQWEIGYYPMASVLRMVLSIYDRSNRPYRFETFINVAEGEQLACITQLAEQAELNLHFFDSRTEYVFTKAIRQAIQSRQTLHGLISEAEADYARLEDQWDFDQAKARFQVDYPLSLTSGPHYKTRLDTES
ncbi:MAG: hypothetical protein AAF629_31310 [Chloroflexota bacterium]